MTAWHALRSARGVIPQQLSNKVVVLTGASSGIGRAAAVAFAKERARVVLAARDGDELEATARLCREAGGEASVLVTDVTREADVQALARHAEETFGGLDVWVNNAGVTLFARITEGPVEEHWRVMETNVLGAIHGARAALPRFEAQGHGVIVNVGSVLSAVGQPYVPSYVVSKFALRGLSETLRTEVARHPGVQVCTLLPYAVDTPHFEAGANRRGRRPRPIPPTQTPEAVATALVDLVKRPRRERYVPRIAELGVALHALFPRTTERLLADALERWHFDDHRPLTTGGNLRTPVRARAHGPRIGTARFLAWVFGDLVKLAFT